MTGTNNLSGGGTLVLNFTSNNNDKIATGVLTLAAGNIALKGGSYTQAVASTTITTGGGHTSISHDGGTSKIAFGAITRSGNSGSGGNTLSLEDDTIATTTSTAVNGILSGGITVGSNWAKVDSGNIVALTSGDYTPLPTGSGATTTTVNYQLTGSLTRTAAMSLNSLRITGDGADQILDLGTNNLRPSLLSDAGSTPGRYSGNSAAGGILYSGGGNGNYTITGTGAASIQAQNSNQELIIHTYAGKLNVEVPLTMGGSGLTKTGVGTLALSGVSTYTSFTHVNQGSLLVNNTTGSGTGTGTVTVQNNANLGGTGTIGGNTTITDGGGLTFDLSTAPGSHDKLDLATAKTLTFSGASTLTITSPGGATTGNYTLLTAPGGISGTLPILNMPSGWAATLTAENSGTDLVLHITTVGGASPYDTWASGFTPNPGLATENPDSDSLTNLQEFAFGTNPNASTGGSITYTVGGEVSATGLPVAVNFADPGVDFRAVFGRRKDYIAAGLTYTVQFSAGLDVWVNSTDTPTEVSNSTTGDIDAVSVPYPLFIETGNGMEKPTFFRVGVSQAP